MKIWPVLLAELEAGRSAGLISVVATKGSAPREAGARMVLTTRGFHGTIGGGALEWRALAEAQADLDRNRRDWRSLDLALGPDMGQCCGGRVVLGFETFSPDDAAAIRPLAEAEEQGAIVTRARLVDGRWQRAIDPDAVLADTISCMRTSHDGMIERFGDSPRRLILFGAGHVGRALVLALAPLPFAVSWVDEREESFPAAMPRTATPVASRDPVRQLEDAPSGSFVVIMTHAHSRDLELVDAALRLGDRFPHVGVIGSATKRARFLSRLRQMGHDEAALARLVCPIGAVGPKSRLPAVIAAAVAVELLVADEAVRAAANPDFSDVASPPGTTSRAARPATRS